MVVVQPWQLALSSMPPDREGEVESDGGWRVDSVSDMMNDWEGVGVRGV